MPGSQGGCLIALTTSLEDFYSPLPWLIEVFISIAYAMSVTL